MFDETSSQRQVYESVGQPMVQEVVSNPHKNGTIFVFGQTGAGKSYTMGLLEDQKSSGIVPRCIHELFASVDHLDLAFYQIYMEKVYDLLESELEARPKKKKPKWEGLDSKMNPNAMQSTPLSVRMNQDSTFFVEGLREVTCNSAVEAWQLISQGLTNRATSNTYV